MPLLQRMGDKRGCTGPGTPPTHLPSAGKEGFFPAAPSASRSICHSWGCSRPLPVPWSCPVCVGELPLLFPPPSLTHLHPFLAGDAVGVSSKPTAAAHPQSGNPSRAGNPRLLLPRSQSLLLFPAGVTSFPAAPCTRKVFPHLPWDVLDVFDALEPVIPLSKMHQSFAKTHPKTHQSFVKTHPSATGETGNAETDKRLSLTSIPALQVLPRIPI